MSSKKNEQMKHITDRACYNIVASFSVEYRLQGVNLSLRTIQSRVKKNIEAEIKRSFSNPNSVPFIVIDDIQFTLEEVIDNEESDTCLCRSRFDIDFTFEEVDNEPELLANQLLKFMFAKINTPKIQNNISSSIAILAPEKGYIQSDRTIYFPSHE
jgi:hypothetical protein